ncbi:MAG: HDOD domain-containing protein [Pseudomonas sp.]
MDTYARAPIVLIADEDCWSSDLLAKLVLNVRGDAIIHCLRDGPSVLECCQQGLPDLVIADWALPGIGGLELLRQLRRAKRQPALPFFLLSTRADVTSVKAALSLAPTAYLTKPFDVEKLLQRLRQVLLRPGEEVVCPVAALAQGETLDGYLQRLRDSAEGAPLLASVQEALQRLNSRDCDFGELERLFGADPQLTAQLIAAANSADRHRGSRCQTLAQALPRLGLVHSLNLALGVALQRSAHLEDPLLVPSAAHFWALSLRTAELARWLAGHLHADAERCYAAGLLHCLGDLALLRTLQNWHEAGGSLDAAQVASSLEFYGAAFGGALRTRWRLPLELRELIGAAWQLGGGVYSREALILHLAAQLARLPKGGAPTSLAESKAARMLGVDAGLLSNLPLPDQLG